MKKENSLKRLIIKLGNEEEANKLWMSKKKTNTEDILGIKNYISNFVRHARELDYESFDLEDWLNFVKICKYVKNDSKFIDFACGKISSILGEDNDFIKDLKNEN